MTSRALLIIVTVTAFLSPAAHACIVVEIPPSPGLLESSTAVYVGKVRSIERWDKAAGMEVYYAIVEVRETLKGAPADVVGALVLRLGMCPSRRLERRGDGVVVYQPKGSDDLMPALMKRFENPAHVGALRDFARQGPDYKPPRREKPEWWRYRFWR